MGDSGLWLQSRHRAFLCRYFLQQLLQKRHSANQAVSEEQVEDLFQRTAANEGYKLTVDLENKTITDEHGLNIAFDLDEHRRQFLLQGLDDIGLTLQHEDKITAYEASRVAY